MIRQQLRTPAEGEVWECTTQGVLCGCARVTIVAVDLDSVDGIRLDGRRMRYHLQTFMKHWSRIQPKMREKP